MKNTIALVLFTLLVLAPVLAVGKRSDTPTDAQLEARCKAEGGCFVVSENGFKKAMLIAFAKGQELGRQACKGSL